MDLKRWLASLETEGHESWGMIEMAFGVAILIGSACIGHSGMCPGWGR